MKTEQLLFGTGLLGAVVYIFAFSFMPALRPALYYEVLFGFLVLACLGHYWDKKGLWRWTGICFLFGLVWEITTEANWAYADNLAPMVYFYRDVPLAVCLWWVINLMLASDFSRRLAKKYGSVQADVLAILLIMLPMESLGFNVLKMWTYTAQHTLSLPYFLPWQVVVGWLFFGSLFLSGIYRYAPQAFKR